MRIRPHSPARWNDERLLGTVWERGYREIDSVFKALPYADAQRALRDTSVERDVRAKRLAARDSVYGRLRKYFVDTVGPQLRTIDRRFAERARLDNAALLARRTPSAWCARGRGASALAESCPRHRAEVNHRNGRRLWIITLRDSLDDEPLHLRADAAVEES